MGGTNEVAGTITLFKGRMTSLVINDTPTGSSVTIDSESRLVDLDRPSHFRYTKESQNFLHSGDTSLNRVSSLQDKQIVWGKTSANGDGFGRGENEAGQIPNRDVFKR